MKEDNNFADVTLACEDGQQIEAHKVILAASSPFFQNLLKRNRHPHPLIYMRGIKSEDLLTMMDFLYCGEANVFQENLDSFLVIAEELRLKGLSEKSHLNGEQIQSNVEPKIHKQPPTVQMNNERRIAVPNLVSGDLQELDEKVKSMMEASQNFLQNGRERAKICRLCGKEGQGVNIRAHIEANHLEGVSLPCNICAKTFRTRMMLRQHKCQVCGCQLLKC